MSFNQGHTHDDELRNRFKMIVAISNGMMFKNKIHSYNLCIFVSLKREKLD